MLSKYDMEISQSITCIKQNMDYCIIKFADISLKWSGWSKNNKFIFILKFILAYDFNFIWKISLDFTFLAKIKVCAVKNSEKAWSHRGAISNCCGHQASVGRPKITRPRPFLVPKVWNLSRPRPVPSWGRARTRTVPGRLVPSYGP